MKWIKSFLSAAVLLAMVGNAMAQSNYLLSACVANINGTTNLTNWKETVEKVTGKGEVGQNTGKFFTLTSFDIIMQVSSIKSDGGSIMDNKTFKALKGGKFPEITFLLAEPVVNIPICINAYSIIAKGRLTIAGVTKSIVMPIKISVDENKKIIVQGGQQIKMSDYNIDPPKALFGIIKTGDVITISFNTTFSLIN